MTNHDPLRQLFGYKEPNHAQALSCVTLRTGFYDLATKILAHTGEGLEQARAMASLQEALWASLNAVVRRGE